MKLIPWLIPFALWGQSGGDAYRGAAILEKEHCTGCHSIGGKGGHTAPDLGVRTSRQYTPSVMASVMWNHAPAMWSAMDAQGLAHPAIGDKQAGDLFAYFYSIRYFEKPGDAGRGKRVFESKHCAECHALEPGGAGPGNAVSQWTAIADPVLLVDQMWNHSSLMKKAFEARKLDWVTLSSQDLVDITVYLQNLPSMRGKLANFWLPGPEGGEALFHGKGCAGCHIGPLALEKRLANQTLIDVAASMWNHAPRMPDAAMVSTEEMRQIVSYVWQTQYLGASGSVSRGRKAFEKKNCASCHSGQSTAPDLRRGERPYSPVSMVAVLWQHGPAMLERMKQQKMAWPRLSPGDVSDLVAYLNDKP